MTKVGDRFHYPQKEKVYVNLNHTFECYKRGMDLASWIFGYDAKIFFSCGNYV